MEVRSREELWGVSEALVKAGSQADLHMQEERKKKRNHAALTQRGPRRPVLGLLKPGVYLNPFAVNAI